MDDPTYNEGIFLSQIYEILSSSNEQKDLAALIEDRREELGISARQVSRVLKLNKESLRRIISGEAQKVDALTLLKLSSFLEVGLDGIAKVFVASMTPESIRELEESRVRNYLVSTFDLDGLKKINFINSITDFDSIAERIKTFFGLESVFEYDTKVARTFFSQTRRSPSDKMREFWVQSAVCQFNMRPNPNEYDRERLMELVPQISQYTRYEKTGLLTVAKALYRAGVTVIAQTYLPFTQVRGATFVIDDKPCIVITDFRKDYSTVWFTLMHELAHVLYHRDMLNKTRYHLTGEDDLFLVEDEADHFARELLFPERKMKYVETLIDNEHYVYRYAKKHNIHPAIIYGFYAYKKYIEEDDNSGYARYNKHMISPDEAIEAIRCYPWDKPTVGEDINQAVDQLEAT